jgi:hypothetical protein
MDCGDYEETDDDHTNFCAIFLQAIDFLPYCAHVPDGCPCHPEASRFPNNRLEQLLRDFVTTNLELS